MTINRRQALIPPLATAISALALRPAFAQAYPDRVIHVVVPFTAGSASDVIPRLVFDRLSSEFGQPIIIDNKPGAGGTIGSASVARAEPDGYTLLAVASAHSVVPSLYPNAPYDTAKDFAGIIPLGSLPQVLVVAPGSPYRTLRELVEAGKKPGKSISYASAGVGSGSHFASERLRLSAGFNGLHVPFKGGPESIAETMSGRVDFDILPVALVLALIKDGKLRPLAVSSPTRAAALPDVPTTIEAGYPDSDYTFWVGVLAPAKTPAAVINKLHDSIDKVLREPDIRDKLANMSVDPMAMSPAAFDAQIVKEIAANAIVIKAANIKGE